MSSNTPNREWAHEWNNCRGVFASTSDLPSALKTVNLSVLTSGFLGGVLVKSASAIVQRRLPEGRIECSKSLHDVHPPPHTNTHGNRPEYTSGVTIYIRLVASAVGPRPIVFTTTVPIKPGRIGSSSKRMISLGWMYLSSTPGSVWIHSSTE